MDIQLRELLLIAHLTSVISWLAGLLYLPRLMVYHSDQDSSSPTYQVLSLMERRLLKIIATPAMVASWIFGISLAFGLELKHVGGWLHIKILLVIILSGYHVIIARHVSRFSANQNQKSTKYFRIINEVPTMLMIAILTLVIIKPF